MNPISKALSNIGSRSFSVKNPAKSPFTKKTPISKQNTQYKKNMEGAYKSKYGSFK